MPFCNKCGCEIAENVTFCPKCRGAQQGGKSSSSPSPSSDKPPSWKRYIEFMLKHIKLLFGHYIGCFKKYVGFKGRATREEFWSFSFIWVLAFYFCVFLVLVFELQSAPLLLNPVIFYFLATLLPAFAVYVRRMHDTGHSAFAVLIPVYGVILLFQDSYYEENEYGPYPKRENDTPKNWKKFILNIAGLFLVLFLFVTLISDESEDELFNIQEKGDEKSSGETSSFKDPRDGKKYKSVKIGSQTWMAQNLDYHGEDGFLGLCYGDQPRNKIKKPENCQKYGRLYNWDEAMKACPKGWHLPSDNEWQTLVDFAGGDEVAGKKLKAKSGWDDKCKYEETNNRGKVTIINHCGTDEYGFSALPGGRGYSGGSFDYVGDNGLWWSATKSVGGNAYSRYVSYNNSSVSRDDDIEPNLRSVRCVQD